MQPTPHAEVNTLLRDALERLQATLRDALAGRVAPVDRDLRARAAAFIDFALREADVTRRARATTD